LLNKSGKWQKDKKIKAAALIQKYHNNEDIKALLIGHYGDDTVVLSEISSLDFSLTRKNNEETNTCF
jgi:hypothetical protein